MTDIAFGFTEIDFGVVDRDSAIAEIDSGVTDIAFGGIVIFLSATVSVASPNRRQSPIETIAPTQNDGHIPFGVSEIAFGVAEIAFGVAEIAFGMADVAFGVADQNLARGCTIPSALN